jgi:hypothetical protein
MCESTYGKSEIQKEKRERESKKDKTDEGLLFRFYSHSDKIDFRHIPNSQGKSF